MTLIPTDLHACYPCLHDLQPCFAGIFLQFHAAVEKTVNSMDAAIHEGNIFYYDVIMPHNNTV